MTFYQGPAALITEGGSEIPVTADLHTQATQPPSWGGTLTAAAEHKTALVNLTQGRLRLADNREAAFLRPNTSDWIGSPAGFFRMRIDGTGDLLA